MQPHSALSGMTTKQVTCKVSSKTQWDLSPVARVRFGRPFLIPDFHFLEFPRATGALRRWQQFLLTLTLVETPYLLLPDKNVVTLSRS